MTITKKKVKTGCFMVTLFLSVTVISAQSTSGGIEFKDVKTQTHEFIGYNDSITLLQGQQKIMDEALDSIPAPCCNNFTIKTCCCPCNLAKSVWGLSEYLIAKNNYDVKQVKESVNGWLKFINKDGHTGDSCYQNRCNKPFRENGCGGMDKENVYF